MPTLQQLAERVQALVPSKWHLDIHHFAEILGVEVEEVNGFIKCIEDGGTGSKTDGLWSSNPAPFKGVVNLKKEVEDNILNMHYTDTGNKAIDSVHLDEPSVASLEQGGVCRYIRLGRVRSRNKEITVKLQREIAKFVVGTHKTLTQFYPDDGEFRKKAWRNWIDGGENSDTYQTCHLPHIAVHFCNAWDAPVSRGMKPEDLTPTVLDLVKREIIEMLVRMHILPKAKLQIIAVRRSNRHMTVSDGESDVEIQPVKSKKRKFRQDNSDLLDADGVDGDLVDESDPNASALQLFNLGAIKELWRNHEYEEVGRREIALLNAHAGKDSSYSNMEIMEYGGMTYSIKEYDSITAISKSTLGRKAQNFDRLRSWINANNPSKLYHVGDGELLLKYAREGTRFTKGEARVTREVFEPTGPRKLKSESAQIARHTVFTCPGIGISKYPEVFTYFFVMFNGRAPTEKEIISASTLSRTSIVGDAYHLDGHGRSFFSFRRARSTPTCSPNQ